MAAEPTISDVLNKVNDLISAISLGKQHDREAINEIKSSVKIVESKLDYIRSHFDEKINSLEDHVDDKIEACNSKIMKILESNYLTKPEVGLMLEKAITQMRDEASRVEPSVMKRIYTHLAVLGTSLAVLLSAYEFLSKGFDK